MSEGLNAYVRPLCTLPGKSPYYFVQFFFSFFFFLAPAPLHLSLIGCRRSHNAAIFITGLPLCYYLQIANKKGKGEGEPWIRTAGYSHGMLLPENSLACLSRSRSASNIAKK